MSKYIYTASTSHTGPLTLALEITDHITPSIAPPRTLFFASPSEFSERTAVGMSQRSGGESRYQLNSWYFGFYFFVLLLAQIRLTPPHHRGSEKHSVWKYFIQGKSTFIYILNMLIYDDSERIWLTLPHREIFSSRVVSSLTGRGRGEGGETVCQQLNSSPTSPE